jgi:hypothetical protein
MIDVKLLFLGEFESGSPGLSFSAMPGHASGGH